MAGDETIRTLEEWIDKYEWAIEQCERGLLRTPEALGLDVKFARELMLALPPGSTASRIFDRRMHEVPPKPHYTKTGYVDESDCAHPRSRLALLHEIADQFGPETLRQIGIAKRQHHIAAGEYGLARRLVYGLMSKAATDLLIVDAYADEAAFPYLESLAPTIRARVLGGRALSPAAKVILEGYQRQGGSLRCDAGARYMTATS